jgi:hypothetical protein
VGYTSGRKHELFLQSSAVSTSREQLFRLLQQEKVALDVFISIGLRMIDSESVRQSIYEVVLRRKGLGLEALAARRLPMLSEQYPKQREKLIELDQISSLISEILVSSRHSNDDLTEARRRKQQLEVELAAKIPEMRFESVLRIADSKSISNALEDHSALIEYTLFHPFDFDGIIANGDEETRPARYLGFVLTKQALVTVKDLGLASQIDHHVMEFAKHLAGEAGGLRHFVTDSEDSEYPESFSTSTQLLHTGDLVRKAVWDPLYSLTAEAKHVLIAPDGQLGILPFDLLPTNNDDLLLNDLLISNVGSGRDLIKLSAKTSMYSSESVIFCAPDFDYIGATGSSGSTTSIPESAQIDFTRSMNDRGISRVSLLPGTLQEGIEIQKLLLGSQLFSGANASEIAIRTVYSPRVLHIATHGFSAMPNTDSPKSVDETMFTSGLIFAGANATLGGKQLDPLLGDGILTGEEAATLQLGGTELVVLSACRSGLGQAVPGEGVFGLHRAFAAAGARCVVVSLWKVPDEQTKDLMVIFYKELSKGLPRAEALQEAKRSIRKTHRHPFFWGSFICYGDWSAVSGISIP